MRNWINLCETLLQAQNRVYYHVTLASHLPSIKKDGLEPRRGPLSILAGEPKRTIFLFVNLVAVEDALMGWLGDHLPEDEPLALLKIMLPEGIKVVRTRYSGFELKVYVRIPPENIEVLSADIDNYRFPDNEIDQYFPDNETP